MRRATRWRRLAVGVLLLAGCTSGGDPAGTDADQAEPSAARATEDDDGGAASGGDATAGDTGGSAASDAGTGVERPTTFDGDPALLAAIDEVEDALRRHPDEAWRVGEAQLAAELDGLRERVDELTRDELALEVVRITALIDGHTVARPLDPWPRAAISIYRFDDGFFVTRADEPGLVGARVLTVGDLPVEEAWEAILPYVSWDSEQTRWLAGPSFLRNPVVLAHLGVVAGPDAVTYTLKRTDGTVVEHTPQVVAADAPPEIADLVTVGLPAVEGVRYLELNAVPFWSEPRPDDDLVVLQFNRAAGSSVSPFTGENVTTGDEVERVEALLDDDPGARLVVDLRHNPGGNNTTLRPFRDLVTARATDPCAVVVLIGRQTFSAAANFATQVEQATPARFYGEPTGGSPNLYGDTNPYTIDELGLRLFVSSRWWQMSDADDTREAIAPDVAVPLTSSDFLAGRDPVMEAVVTDPVCAGA